MSKRKKNKQKLMNVTLDPEQRLVPKFDSVSIAKFPVASREDMGMRVLDNCAEEHIQ